MSPALGKENSTLREKEKTFAGKYRKIDSYFRHSAATIADNALNNAEPPHVIFAVIQKNHVAQKSRQDSR